MDHSSELCFLLPPASCSTGGSLLPIAPGVAGGGGASAVGAFEMNKCAVISTHVPF